jgi:competence ComEA-like helix-hairpin-helix protein
MIRERGNSFPTSRILRAFAAAALPAAFFITLAVALAAHPQDGQDRTATAFTRVCSSCHDAERILSARRTRTQWEEIIEKMIERGAEGTDDDFTAAEQYLLRVSGRVNVNRALGTDLVAVLGLTQKDADAIVEHRKAHGDFKDFDDLCKVPGIDLEKLKQGRDAVSF